MFFAIACYARVPVWFLTVCLSHLHTTREKGSVAHEVSRLEEVCQGRRNKNHDYMVDPVNSIKRPVKGNVVEVQRHHDTGAGDIALAF